MFETRIGAGETERCVGRRSGGVCNNAVTEIRRGVCDAVERGGFVSGEDGWGWSSPYFCFCLGHGEVGAGDELCFRDMSSMI